MPFLLSADGLQFNGTAQSKGEIYLRWFVSFSLQPFQVIATHLMILQTKLDWNLVLIKVNTKRPQQRGFTKGQGWAPVSNVGK